MPRSIKNNVNSRGGLEKICIVALFLYTLHSSGFNLHSFSTIRILFHNSTNHTSATMTPPITKKDSQKEHEHDDDVIVSATTSSKVKRLLWSETAEGLGNVMGNIRSTWYGDEAVFYSREEERLRKYIPPFQYGLAATVFLFLNFRVTGNPGFQKLRQNVWQRVRPSSSSTTSPTTGIPPPQQGYLETKRKTQVEEALKSMKFLTDFLISLSVGTSGTLFLLEAKKEDMRIDYEDGPLIPGRSILADDMCPGMLKLYQTDPSIRQVLEDNERKKEQRKWEQSDHNLVTFSTFIHNCTKREDYESKIRKEQGKSENDPISIPHTGLR